MFIQINCLPHHALSIQINQSLIEILMPTHYHPFDPIRLKTFGSLCYASDRRRKSKISPLAKQYIFVGIEEGADAVRLWEKHSTRTLVTCNLIHVETMFPAQTHNKAPKVTATALTDDLPIIAPTQTWTPMSGSQSFSSRLPSPSTPKLCHRENLLSPFHSPGTSYSIPILTKPPGSDETSSESGDLITSSPVVDIRRSSRETRMPDCFGFVSAAGADTDHPTYSQAMEEEIESLLHHNVGTLVNTPAGASVLSGM